MRISGLGQARGRRGVALLADCSRLPVLITSRVSLPFSGEREYPVALLTLPTPGKPLSEDSIDRSEAVTTSVERARAATEGAASTPSASS